MTADEIELTVETVGARGDGIAPGPAGPVYLPFTAPGDRVCARLGPKRGEGRAGEVTRLLQAGPDRVEPACPHFGTCGGCALQHLAPGFYRDWKRQLVAGALARRGLQEVAVETLIETPPGTRRRADFGLLRRRDGRVVIGYHERASNRLVDLAACPVLDPALVRLLDPLRDLLADLLRPGERGAALATATDGGVDLLLEIPLEPDLAARERLAEFADAADLARLTLRLEDFDDPVARRRPATVAFGKAAVESPPGGFLQASPPAEAALTAAALTALTGAARVADLFAGAGTFALPLAETAAVHAVDSDAGLIGALKVAAAAAELHRVTTEVRDLYRRPLQASELKAYDAVLFDPPRAGARDQAEQLAASSVPVVVGISCNPASFARDARLLVDGGYRLARVQPVDEFLWSPHVELIGVFQR